MIVPAAGAGLRMGGGTRKQFRVLGDAPVLVQTLRAFEAHDNVDALAVVVPPEEVEPVSALLDVHALTKLVAVVAGGATRQASVGQGLDAVVAHGAEESSLVLVHDGVRPFIDADAIARVIAAAQSQGAAALALAVADTLRRGDGNTFGDTVPRDGLWRMQTPQAFRMSLLVEAHAAARRDAFAGTDEVALVQRIGHAVQIVPGSAFNVKLTRPSDWAFAEAVWPVWLKQQGRNGTAVSRV
ncbi:MAG: 2-C-methyl-D-erythritol 4-phosphate cytidylyltransferase [Bacteroidota bacterium]